MAKVKQPLEENGIHRAKMWEIMMYALNNTSTNTYMVVVGYISYFRSGIRAGRFYCYHHACLGRCHRPVRWYDGR